MRFVAVVAAAALVGLLGVSVAAAGGNASNAKLCQKGGWQTAQTDSGGSLASNDQCTSYAAQGGALFAPELVLTPGPCLSISFGGVINGPFAQVHFDASGFHPNTSISFQIPSQAFPLPVAVTTDANGSASLPGWVLYDPGSAAGMTAFDADGVHTSLSFTAASCP